MILDPLLFYRFESMTMLSIVILLISLFDEGIAFLKWRFDRLEVDLCLVQVGWDSWEYDPNIAIPSL